MKKLLILALVLVVAGGLFAQVTAGGRVRYGALTNFADAPGQHWDNQLKLTGVLDEFNTVMLKFRFRGTEKMGVATTNASNAGFFPTSQNAGRMDSGYLQSNVTGAFGIKGDIVDTMLVGIVANVKTADFTDGNSPFSVSDITEMGFGDFNQAVVYNRLDIAKMASIRACLAPGSFKEGAGGYFISADAGFGPVAVALTYQGKGTVAAAASSAKGAVLAIPAQAAQPVAGLIGLGVKYSQMFDKLGVTVIPQFQYSLDADTKYSIGEKTDLKNIYKVAVTAKVNYDTLATFKLGYLGITESLANRMEMNLNIMPLPVIAFDIGTVLFLDEKAQVTVINSTATAYPTSAKMVNEIDFAATLYMGKGNLRVGYLYLNKDNLIDSVMKGDNIRVGRGASGLTGTSEPGGLYIETSIDF